jgi:hypothetical protein
MVFSINVVVQKWIVVAKFDVSLAFFIHLFIEGETAHLGLGRVIHVVQNDLASFVGRFGLEVSQSTRSLQFPCELLQALIPSSVAVVILPRYRLDGNTSG